MTTAMYEYYIQCARYKYKVGTYNRQELDRTLERLAVNYEKGKEVTT